MENSRTITIILINCDFFENITDDNLDSFKKIEVIELDIPKHGYTFKINVAAEETKLREPYNHCKESPYNQMNFRHSYNNGCKAKIWTNFKIVLQ